MINQSQLLLLLKVTILAFILGAIALPSILELISPFWLTVIFIYWLIYSDSNGIFSAALYLDYFLMSFKEASWDKMLLRLSYSSAFILSVKKSFFVSNLTTQQVYVFIASLIYLVCIFNYAYIVQGLQIQWLILFVPFTGAIMWPVVRFLLGKT